MIVLDKRREKLARATTYIFYSLYYYVKLDHILYVKKTEGNVSVDLKTQVVSGRYMYKYNTGVEHLVSLIRTLLCNSVTNIFVEYIQTL